MADKYENYDSLVNKYFGSYSKYSDLCKKYFGSAINNVEDKYIKKLNISYESLLNNKNKYYSLIFENIKNDIKPIENKEKIIYYTIIAIIVFVMLLCIIYFPGYCLGLLIAFFVYEFLKQPAGPPVWWF